MSTFADLQEHLMEGVKLVDEVSASWRAGEDSVELLYEKLVKLEHWANHLRKNVIPPPRLTL